MKIQELRIGNIVMVDNPKYHPRLDGIPLRVTGFEERVISSRSDHVVRLEHIKQKPNSFYESYSQFLKFIKPITLTEEILLKCGFEKDDTGVDMFDPDYAEWYQMEFPVIGILCQSSDKKYLFDENTDTLRIQYLHQLQNLFFDLTGEELEVKL